MLAVLAGAVALTFTGITAANASPAPAATCSGGHIAPGTYSTLKVTGFCTVPQGKTVVVRGAVTVAPKAALDASTAFSTFKVGGYVVAGRNSQVSLGCTPAHPCDGYDGSQKPAFNTSTHVSVAGSVTLNGVYNAAFNGVEIGGNLVSSYGGAGLLNPEEQFIPFSVKDDTIRGNVVITNLRTVWFGVIRSQIGGNLVLLNNHTSDPDGNEVATNQIRGNLSCYGNSPRPQIGDSGGAQNAVGGHRAGQCAGKLPVSPQPVS